MATAGDSKRGRRMAPNDARSNTGDDEWLRRVAQGACRDAGNVSEELLGDYLPMLAVAAMPSGSSTLMPISGSFCGFPA